MDDTAGEPSAYATPPVSFVCVAQTSPIGRQQVPIERLAEHLPAPERAEHCSFCWPPSFWPCGPFDTAVHQLENAGLRPADFVPGGLHRRLWSSSPVPRPSRSTETS